MLGMGVNIWTGLSGYSSYPGEVDLPLLAENGSELLAEDSSRLLTDTFSPSYFSTNLYYWDNLIFGQMFQDSTGLTPVTDEDQPLGKLVDQSTNNNHALQSSSSLRPTVKKSVCEKFHIHHDRVDDQLSIASLAAGTYTTGIATWSRSQIYSAVQKTTGTYNLNQSDSFARVLVDRVLTTNETLNFTRWLEAKRPTPLTGETDVLRLWIDTNSVDLSVTESADSGSTWVLGDGQTATGTSCVKTITAPQSVIYRAITPSRITSLNWSSKSLYGQLDLSKLTGLTSVYFAINKLSGGLDIAANTGLATLYANNNYLCGTLDFTYNTALITIQLSLNQFSGNLNVATNIHLTTLDVSSNKLSTFSGTVSNILGNCDLSSNLFTQAAVDAILAAFVTAGRVSGTRTLNLGGTGNAAPSVAGLASVSILQARGWTVTHN